MFPEGARFMQDITEVIDMSPEEKYVEVSRSAEITPKRDIDGAGIDQLVTYFDGKTYNYGRKYLMTEQESKDDTG